MSFTNNRLNTNPFNGASMQYDQAGNLKNDGYQSFAYDATGQQTYASGLGAGGSAPVFIDDPLKNPENPESFKIKLIHLSQLREAVNGLRVRAGLPAVSDWNPDPNPQQNVTTVKAEHIRQLRTKLAEALNALHLPVGGYEHPTLTENESPIYAVDFQELRTKIKDAWTALANSGLAQFYDGDGLRVKKTESGAATYYLRSSVLGGQVLAEISGGAVWQRGYVYAGSSLMAVQQGSVNWVHEDPVTKSKRVTDINGTVVSTIDLDPWGGETSRSANAAFQPQRYTSYTRDSNGGDEAMFRRYQSNWTRFSQPDPYDGSYDLTDPQSFNRYAYVQNDPVNFVDPSGTNPALIGLLMAWAANSGSWTVDFYGSFASAILGGGGGGGDHGVVIATDIIGTEGGGGGGGGIQEPTTVPAGDLRTSVQNLLKQRDCAEYLQKLLNEANKIFAGNYPHVKTFWEAFDKISAAGGYQLTPGSYHRVTGDLFARGARPATAHIIPFRTYGRPTAANISYAQASYYPFAAVHETFHLARQGGYTDEQMATAAYSLAGKKMPPVPAGLTGYAKAAMFSARFDNELQKHCPKR